MEKGGAFFVFSERSTNHESKSKSIRKAECGSNRSPKRYGVPLPAERSRCEGCPYPRVGFICWSPDGTCMKTDVDAINRRSKGR